MRAFTEPLTQLQGYEELEQAVQKTEGVILVSGCIDAVKPHIVYSVHNGSGNRIIVTFHEQKAKELLEEYRFLIKRGILSGERYSFLSVGYPWKCSDIRTYQCPENDG